MKRLCVGLALLLAGCAGTEVQGIVRDESTGEPLEGATVQIGDESGRTDESGRFELDVDDDDMGRVKVDKEGYAPVSETMTIDGEAGEVDHEFRMQPATEAGAPNGSIEQKKLEEPAGIEEDSSVTKPSSSTTVGEDGGMRGLREAEDEELRQRLKGAETNIRVEPSGK
jgi:hypothetical protein